MPRQISKTNTQNSMKTETKHTPGPWRSHVAHELLNVVADSVVSVDGLHVADVASYGASIATRNANAHLIAAAPELLEALYAALPCVEESEEFDKPHSPKLSVTIRALLANAEGNA